MFDRDLSLAVQNRMKAYIRTSQCWANAWKCVSIDPGLINCLYVEGWATVDDNDGNPPMPIEHGWIETLDGKIIDPTFANQDFEVKYFPAVKYDDKERSKLRKKAEKELPLYASLHNYHHPDYSAAFESALAYSREQY